MNLIPKTPSEKFDFLKNLFCGKTQEEIAANLSDSITTIRMITMSADDGEWVFYFTLSSCIKIGCGTVFTDAKKNAVIKLIPDELVTMIERTPEDFFTPANEVNHSLVCDLMKANDLLTTNMLKLIFAVAYVGDLTDNSAIEKAREILISSGIDPDVEYEISEYEDSFDWDE